MQSLLITGGNLISREKKAKEIAGEYSSQFDTQIFDANEKGGIDVTREIISKTKNKPYESKLTNIIVLEANNLTSEAQNALLKLLEEPTDTLQLVLTATSRDSLLPTVASRLSEVNLAVDTNSAIEISNFEEFNNQTLSGQLTKLEQTKRESYILFWQSKLEKEIRENGGNLKSLHRYNKLILKMQKAEKANVNKKLIDLILALEIPKI